MNVIDKEKRRELLLHQRAEAITRHMLSAEATSDRLLSPAESQKVLHELRVHQIELEMQNEVSPIIGIGHESFLTDILQPVTRMPMAEPVVQIRVGDPA